MCGIAGFVNLSRTAAKKEVISKMTKVISYRGPDDEGFFIKGNVALGARRLSIIDILGGRQPLYSENKKIAVVFNGEIYNFKELRRILTKKGHKLKTNSDTEVIVHLYEEEEEDLFEYLTGMFALAIWDQDQEKLVLARDRFGEKPLYYGLFDNTFIFGSELKSILAHPKAKREIDPNSLNRYLTFEYVPSPFSIFKNIKKLEAGHYLVLKKGRIKTKKYWDINFEHANFHSQEEILEKLEDLLDNTIKSRLIADVPVGVFLSGGIDSTTICYFAAKNSNKKIKSFNIGFEEESFDESDFAQKASSYLNLDHYSQTFLVSDLIDLIPKAIEFLDEPFADASILPTYILSNFARQKVKVVLGGDGGDELFMGYPTFQAHKIATLYGFIPRLVHDKLISPIVESLPVSYANFSFDFKAKKTISGIYEEHLIRNQIWLGAFSQESLRRKIFTKNFQKLIKREDPIEELICFKNMRRFSNWQSLLYQYQKTYLSDDILVKVDRASMNNSLEVRSPFLDHNFADFVNSLPLNLKLHGFTTKYILKKLMEKKLPREIVYRPKHGFGIPVASWLRKDLKSLLFEKLNKKKLGKEGIFNTKFVDVLVRNHIEGKKDNRKLLWTLLMFELWRENWVS